MRFRQNSGLNIAACKKSYLEDREREISKLRKDGYVIDTDIIWDGDGVNHNAALTVFRHFDSASVITGLLGNTPKTAWIVDYPLLERIHYLLVAGFDVFGNVGHQLETRLYMDFLRMEGESNFLRLLPKNTRLPTHQSWYQGASKDLQNYIYTSRYTSDVETQIQYTTTKPINELFIKMKSHLGTALDDRHILDSKTHRSEHQIVGKLQSIKGRPITIMPQASILVVNRQDKSSGFYTLINNSAHTNVSYLLDEKDNRKPSDDTLTVAKDIVGAYPNAFFVVPEEDLNKFVESIVALSSSEDYFKLKTEYGIRRTASGFWSFPLKSSQGLIFQKW